jgi:hypothetical protein
MKSIGMKGLYDIYGKVKERGEEGRERGENRRVIELEAQHLAQSKITSGYSDS